MKEKSLSIQNFNTSRPERILLLGYFDPKGISTVPETLASFQKNSIFAVTCLNLFEHRYDNGNLKLSPEIDLDVFDVLVVHNSVAYNPDNLVSLDALTRTKFSDFSGIKVLLKQDENYRFRDTSEAIRNMGFDLVFTCLPEKERGKIYPLDVVGDHVRFEQMLTGYVTPALRARYLDARDETRDIDIGYRGSLQPLEFGRLCYEKRQIADEVSRRLKDWPLKLDVSSRWEDRFGGQAWFTFLLRCKCVLGVESGASIFDLDGDLDERIRDFVSVNGPVSNDADYCDRFLQALNDLEGNVAYNQISPRHFEAAACGALQIMYPGEYSGIFLPGRHYLVLQRDFSNLKEVLDSALDPIIRKKIVQRTYDEIIVNPEYSVETFVKRVDSVVLELLETKGGCQKARVFGLGRGGQGMVLAPHRAALDPRLRWFVESPPQQLSILLMGLEMGGKASPSSLMDLSEFIGDQPVVSADERWLTSLAGMVGVEPVGNAVLRELLEFERLLKAPNIELCERFGIPSSSLRLSDFRWYLGYLMDVTRSLVIPALRTRGLHFVVAADLPSLMAALLMKSMQGVRVIYDAHEYWAENDARSESFEISFWQNLERRLVPYADRRQTVSPGLAQMLTKETGCEFLVVPNCVPKSDISSLDDASCLDRGRKANVTFLFQGLLTPGRGLETLIEAWSLLSDEEAQLVFRGPDGDFKEILRNRAKELGLLNRTVIFLPPVEEDDLVRSARDFDVGLIPYPPTNNNNSNCCPNKLSQYMAAGLPILAAETNFVKEIVETARCGVVVDITKTASLVDAVHRLTKNHSERAEWANNAKIYFAENFNWEVVSASMYREIREMCPPGEASPPLMWPSTLYSLYRSNGGRFSVDYLNSNNNSNDISERVASSVGATRRFSYSVWGRLPESARCKLRPFLRKLINKGSR